MTTMNTPAEFRAGFVSFVGRPNVGKSSLTNALVGEKIAITSTRPQTTRRVIRAIAQYEQGQIIVVDTPGIHRPRTLLGERLNDLVQETLSDVDVIGFCLPANEAIGPGDRYINEQLDDYPRARKVAIVTKIDTVSRDEVFAQLAQVDSLRDWDAVVPVATDNQKQLEQLAEVLLELLPVSPPLYDREQVTEETEESRVSELIREAALEEVREELPHSIAVTIEDELVREDGLTEIYANLIVERDSQKGIIIGKKGSRLRSIGERARTEIEAFYGSRVFLSLRVKVLKEWQKDPKQLNRLGF